MGYCMKVNVWFWTCNYTARKIKEIKAHWSQNNNVKECTETWICSPNSKSSNREPFRDWVPNHNLNYHKVLTLQLNPSTEVSAYKKHNSTLTSFFLKRKTQSHTCHRFTALDYLDETLKLLKADIHLEQMSPKVQFIGSFTAWYYTNKTHISFRKV